MQVILGRVKDNWRHAHIKGNSSLHLLDKFSIALHCERRILATSDSNLPNIAISGTLPKVRPFCRNSIKLNIGTAAAGES